MASCQDQRQQRQIKLLHSKPKPEGSQPQLGLSNRRVHGCSKKVNKERKEKDSEALSTNPTLLPGFLQTLNFAPQPQAADCGKTFTVPEPLPSSWDPTSIKHLPAELQKRTVIPLPPTAKDPCHCGGQQGWEQASEQVEYH
ncbi:unnamed protein product [Pleuronectes platessa]|uniref:Uncharacterized protein n=1 Tax=Pleuronectes platessa TaxID=8262 RepID=A0A9N7UDW5_PLEPL|nr:unnamed protein product [Pleuronectes platessa]